jgi:site-specific recombinase XerD
MTELDLPAAAPIVLRPSDPPPPDYTDADYSITAETAARLIAATPDNTIRAYDRNWSQFTRWCAGKGRVALPATPQTLTDYVTDLIGIGLAPASIDQAIGTIRSKHTGAGYDRQPDTRGARKLLRGYKVERAEAGLRTRKAAPILIDALRAMVSTCDQATPKGKRDRALLLLGFNGMTRRSELAGLNIADVREAGDEGVTLYIKRSKTDKEAEGADVSVPFGQHADTCAVRAVRAWVAELAEHGITEGALFRPVDRHGRVAGERLTAGKPAARLSGQAVSNIVRQRAQLAAVKDAAAYSGHSMRSGAATSAYLAGAPVAEIAKHGRWLETSPVVLGYIRAVDQWRHNPMKGIGL